MIQHDASQKTDCIDLPCGELVRSLPVISTADTINTATRLKNDLCATVEAKAAVQDDSVGLALHEKYAGAHFWDEDAAFKVVGVHFTRWAGEEYWIATSVPITCVNGKWKVPACHVVGESTGGDDDAYIHDSLQHYSISIWPMLRTLTMLSSIMT